MSGGISAGEGSKVKTGSSTSVAKSGTKVDSDLKLETMTYQRQPSLRQRVRHSQKPSFQPGLRQMVRHPQKPSFPPLRAATNRLQNEEEDLGANSTWGQCCRNYVLCGKESCNVAFENCTCDGGMRLRNE